jgi:hypothetical protein
VRAFELATVGRVQLQLCSGVGNGSSNISNKFLPSLTDSIYTDIEASAAAEVQPAVSAVIKVDQKVVKAEKCDTMKYTLTYTYILQ